MKTVLCHGVFDVLHIGHIRYLESAKMHEAKGSLLNKLIVSITKDEFVNKGPGRPYFDTATRKEMLEALVAVDEVIVSEGPTAIDSINKIKPDFYVKGPDYKNNEDDITGEILNEVAAVEKHGGKVVYTEDATHSSSTLINKFFQKRTPEQNDIIDRVQSVGGMKTVFKVLDDISKLKVFIVGEHIQDIYTFCEPEGVSNKAASVSARYRYEESYSGGVSAVIAHVRNFVKVAEGYFEKDFVCRKTRYLTHDTHQKMFEVTNINDDIWTYRDPKKFIRFLRDMHKHTDMTMFCDFGHGVFEGEVLEAIKKLDKFIALNVQTNSSNIPYNPFTKHKRFDYLTMDLKEAKIATHDRYSDRLTLFDNVRAMVREQCNHISMTLGSNGSYYSQTNENDLFTSPAFADKVVDATGAGDAFFAITSLLVKVDCPAVLIPFLGNVFAGLKTKTMCNKEAVKKADFVKAVRAILK